MIILFIFCLLMPACTSSVNIRPRPTSTNQISEASAIGLLLFAYTETEEDRKVLANFVQEKNPDIRDRNQYREGFINRFKKMVLAFDEKEQFASILNNDFAYSGGMKNKPLTITHTFGEYPIPDSICNFKGMTLATNFYELGEMRAVYYFGFQKELIEEEVKLVAQSHFLRDIKTYREKGQIVPENELPARLSEAPHLRSMIYLKNRLSVCVCSDCVSVQ